MSGFAARLKAKALQEPLAVLVLITTVTLATLNSGWFWELFAGKIKVEAHYEAVFDGRCSLTAFSFDNHSNTVVEGIRIRVLNDWLQSVGDAKDQIGTRTSELIIPEIGTPLAYRDDLQIPFRLKAGVIEIDAVAPGEYIDFFVLFDTGKTVVALRKVQSRNDKRHRFTPRLFSASYAGGKIAVNSIGDCLSPD